LPHNSLALILRGKTEFSESKMDDLFEAVTYRLGTMYEADYMKKELYEKLHDLIKDKRLVTRPIGGGLRYGKPMQYLALALTESGFG